MANRYQTNYENLLEFKNNYELIADTSLLHPTQKKTTTCRYCGCFEPEVSFEEKTHLLPELLGENDVLTYDECDSCNRLFSGFESHLAIFFRPYLTLLGIKGKSKVPTFESRSIDGDSDAKSILKHINKDDKNFVVKNQYDFSINREARTFEMVFRKSRLIPLNIYKALLKIGLSLLPKEQDENHKMVFDWLIGKSKDLHFIPLGAFTTRTNFFVKVPSAQLYKLRKPTGNSEVLPEYCLVVFFANQVVQIFLPFSDAFKEKHMERTQLKLIFFPPLENLDEARTVAVSIYDLGVETHVEHNHQMTFKYDSSNEVIPND